MDFRSASPSTVKSIRQLELLNSWIRLYAKIGRVPPLEDFQPECIREELSDLIYNDVVTEGGRPRFVMRRKGAHLTEIFGGNGEGRFLDEFIGPKLAQSTLPIYLECVSRRLPAYSVCMVSDPDGRQVAYERLLLPFSNGTEIDSIVGSFKAISEDGGFQMKNLMRGDNEEPTYILRAIIDRDLALRAPGRIAADDVVASD